MKVLALKDLACSGMEIFSSIFLEIFWLWKIDFSMKHDYQKAGIIAWVNSKGIHGMVSSSQNTKLIKLAKLKFMPKIRNVI